MVYSLPRKSRGEWPDVSTSFRSPARTSTERARELQAVLEASGYIPGTPRRPHTPLTSTPLARRSLRPYGEFPESNWSAKDADPPTGIARLRQTKRSPFAPRRRPAPEAPSSPQLALHAPSPASSTDDPLLLDESGTPNLTMQAAHGDAKLVSMVRGMEKEDLATRATPDLYDRSIGIRERISLIKSPTKGAEQPREAAPEVPNDDTPQANDDTLNVPREEPRIMHSTPAKDQSARPASAAASTRRSASRSHTSQPRYIDFFADNEHDDNAHDNTWISRDGSPSGLKFVWGGSPRSSITRTRKSRAQEAEAARQAAEAAEIEAAEAAEREAEAAEAAAKEAYLRQAEEQEAAERAALEAAEREAAERAAAEREAAEREAAEREAAERAAIEEAERQAAEQEAAEREAAEQEAAEQEAAEREAAEQEAAEQAAVEAAEREAAERAALEAAEREAAQAAARAAEAARLAAIEAEEREAAEAAAREAARKAAIEAAEREAAEAAARETARRAAIEAAEREAAEAAAREAERRAAIEAAEREAAEAAARETARRAAIEAAEREAAEAAAREAERRAAIEAAEREAAEAAREAAEMEALEAAEREAAKEAEREAAEIAALEAAEREAAEAAEREAEREATALEAAQNAEPHESHVLRSPTKRQPRSSRNSLPTTPPRSTPPLMRGTPSMTNLPGTPWGNTLKDEPPTPLSGRQARVRYAGKTPRFSRTHDVSASTPRSLRYTPRTTPHHYDDERDDFGPGASFRRGRSSLPIGDDPTLPSDGTFLDDFSMEQSRVQSLRASNLESDVPEEDELEEDEDDEDEEQHVNEDAHAAPLPRADTQQSQSSPEVADTSTDLPEPPQVTPLDRFEQHTPYPPVPAQLSPVPEASEEISARERSTVSRPARSSVPPRRIQRAFVRDAEEEALLHTTPGRQSLLGEERPRPTRHMPTRIPVPVRNDTAREPRPEKQSIPSAHIPQGSPFFQRFQRLPGESLPHVASGDQSATRRTPEPREQTESTAQQEDIPADEIAPQLSRVPSAVSPVKRQQPATAQQKPISIAAAARPFSSAQFANELSSARKRKNPDESNDDTATQPQQKQTEQSATADASASLSQEAISDLSASLSASSHDRAMMLARARPTACVEVSSIDPQAAARAAAILKVHHQYIEEGWLAQQDPAASTLPGLLVDAERSLRHAIPATPAARAPATPWLPGAFTPRSARRAHYGAPKITAHALRPQAQAGRWSQDAWIQLDMQLHAFLRDTVDDDVPSDALREAIVNVDTDEVVLRFLDAQGLEPEDLTGEWTLTKLYARVPALQARLLRQLKVDTNEVSALLERSMHKADGNRNVSFGSPFVRGTHSTPLTARVAPASAEASVSVATAGEQTIDVSDQLYEGTALPPRKRVRTDDPDSSIAARLWRGIWPWKHDSAKAQDTTAAEQAHHTGNDNTPSQSNVSQNNSRANTTATIPPRTSFGGFGVGLGSSGVQSTAFSALGDEAQTQATAAAAQFARRRAARWESPLRARAQRNAALRARAHRIGDASTSLAVPSTFDESRVMWMQREHA